MTFSPANPQNVPAIEPILSSGRVKEFSKSISKSLGLYGYTTREVGEDLETGKISGMFLCNIDWREVNNKMVQRGYMPPLDTMPRPFVGGLEADKYVPPDFYERQYFTDNPSAPSFTTRIEIHQDTRVRYGIESFLERTFSRIEVEADRYAPMIDWLKVNNDYFLDIITFQIWAKFSPATYLKASDESVGFSSTNLPSSPQTITETIRRPGVQKILVHIAELASQKVALPDLESILHGQNASPIVIYSQDVLHLQVESMTKKAEFGQRIVFSARVTNKSANVFDRRDLTIRTISDSYKSERDWVVDKNAEYGELEQGQTMEGTITVDPIPEKLDPEKLETEFRFSLRSSEDHQLGSKTIPLPTKPFVISPSLFIHRSLWTRYKGAQIKIEVKIPTGKDQEPLPIKVRLLPSPDFKIDYPANGEFTTQTGDQPCSVYVTPTRAGFPGYSNELNLAYYFGDKELQTDKSNLDRGWTYGDKLSLTVLPNITDSLATALTAGGGILSAFKVIPNPSGDLATTLPNLTVGALALYLGLRVTSWTLNTQKASSNTARTGTPGN